MPLKKIATDNRNFDIHGGRGGGGVSSGYEEEGVVVTGGHCQSVLTLFSRKWAH